MGWFLLGLVIGATIGVFVAGLLAASSRGEE
jgi:gas vesicle protein